MSSQSPNTSSVSTEPNGEGTGPAAGFGPNEWLVDEIYQQYLQDPNSVDRAWWDFFADYKPGADAATTTPTQAVPATTPAPVVVPPAGTAAPSTNGASATTAAAPAPAAPAPVAPAAPAPAPAPAAKPAPAPAQAPAAKAAPKPAEAPGDADGPEYVALRGPSAAVAKNMNA